MAIPGVLNLQADESSRSLFRRVTARPFDVGLNDVQKVASVRPDRQGGLYAGDVVELHGNSSAGKTEIIMHAVARTILPEPGGTKARRVVYIDHDGRLDVRRLKSIIVRRLASLPDGRAAQQQDAPYRQGVDTPSEVRGEDEDEKEETGGAAVVVAVDAKGRRGKQFDSLLLRALERVWVLRCSHTFEFVASLEVLQKEFRGGRIRQRGEKQRAFHPQAGALVIIDSMGAFFYRDKTTEAVAGEGTALQKHALRILVKLVADRCVLVIAAKPALFNPWDGKRYLGHREYMPRMWKNLVAFRVEVVARRPNESSGGFCQDRGSFETYISKGLPGGGD
jgi:RecA/RadA recombinase